MSVNGNIKVWADREEGVVGHAFFWLKRWNTETLGFVARSCGFVFVWSCCSVGRCPLFLFKAVSKASGWFRDGFGKQARVVSPNNLAVHVVFLYGPEK